MTRPLETLAEKELDLVGSDILKTLIRVQAALAAHRLQFVIEDPIGFVACGDETTCLSIGRRVWGKYTVHTLSVALLGASLSLWSLPAYCRPSALRSSTACVSHAARATAGTLRSYLRQNLDSWTSMSMSYTQQPKGLRFTRGSWNCVLAVLRNKTFMTFDAGLALGTNR